MSTIRSLLLAAAGCVTPVAAGAQAIPPGTPSVVVQRIAQAIWPDQLFDSLGRPRPGFAPFAGAPLFESLTIEHRTVHVARLPGVEFYVGSAAGNCFDCGGRVAAVALRGDTSITLDALADLDELAARFGARFPQGDSAGIRGYLLDLLNATCLAGCPARLLGWQDPLPREDSLLARPAMPTSSAWRRSATYATVHPGRMEMEFVVLVPWQAIWTARIVQARDGGYLDISLHREAALGPYP